MEGTNTDTSLKLFPFFTEVLQIYGKMGKLQVVSSTGFTHSIRVKSLLEPASQKYSCALLSHLPPLASITTTLSPTGLPWNFIGTKSSLCLASPFNVILVSSIHTLPTYVSFGCYPSLKIPVLSVLNFGDSRGYVE